jgi:hypothetical protein
MIENSGRPCTRIPAAITSIENTTVDPINQAIGEMIRSAALDARQAAEMLENLETCFER